MSYLALVQAFEQVKDLPLPVDEVMNWIRNYTDHKDIRLHPVGRKKKAFRGSFRLIGIPSGNMYSGEYDIHCQILYGGTYLLNGNGWSSVRRLCTFLTVEAAKSIPQKG